MGFKNKMNMLFSFGNDSLNAARAEKAELEYKEKRLKLLKASELIRIRELEKSRPTSQLFMPLLGYGAKDAVRTALLTSISLELKLLSHLIIPVEEMQAEPVERLTKLIEEKLKGRSRKR